MKNKDHTPVDQILEDRFGQLNASVSAPKEIRDEVFSTIDTLSFLAELADFFTVRFTDSEWSMLEAVSDAMFGNNHE
ncbi:hypothetical protein [Flavilitoribacter nigricans]|uniref:Uncharacterized protein n=1 Tax=Flavilitoribacter nigricans (strain ATCC 23147 / DSM 23189 / NBRC 102662 / NCIMB 1420 / SS-2) TaxID=1122177 RepID=A0A2D0N5E2_FLAN2|nr:hypothetical protein [Flavilitoribacter nigricans]PHN03731.1 hypothetical protein CRP01_24565 [Flavilitoribacter nigricans DSM 23189 = NBRC 102662]